MRRKLFLVVLLVVGLLGVLVVEGVSQPVPPASVDSGPRPILPAPSPVTPPPTVAAPEHNPNFSAVQPQQQEWTFEQLVEALKGVRSRQKELQKQEADLLIKIAAQVEEKRNDLSKSEEVLRQLRGDPTVPHHKLPPRADFFDSGTKSGRKQPDPVPAR